MYQPTFHDINRIYAGFNDAYRDTPEQFDFVRIEQFCDNDSGVRLALNTDVAKGYWDLFRANDQLLICIADGMYQSEYSQSIQASQDVISIRFLLSGALTLSPENNSLGATMPQASASFLYMPKDQQFDLTVSKGSNLCSVTIHMDPQLLYQGFGVNPKKLPAKLADVLYGREFDPQPYNLPLTPGMLNNVLDLVNMSYRGARRRLYTEAKTAELVCQLFEEVERDRMVGRNVTAKNTRKHMIFAAQKILIENYAAPPTISELARLTGLNRSTLSAGFKEIFGTTVFEFSQDYRMNKARELIHSSNMTIAQVSELVGYDHPTNFSSAFKKHYGLLPKQVRPVDYPSK